MRRPLLLAALLALAAPPASHAQVFLASTPHPDFSIGPLFVVANVRSDLSTVTVNVSFSLTPRPNRRVEDIAQDLYLLWPAEVAESTAPGDADPALTRFLEARGFTVVRTGRLTLRTRDRMQLGTGVPGELIGEVASYATFVRPGPASLLGTGTYVKIPWTPKMADPLSVMTLGLPLRGLVTPKAATWVSETFWGRRWIITAGYGDVGSLVLPLYPLYFERRANVVHLAREFSLVIVNFADSDHLHIDEISPASAARRQSRLRASTELVSLTLSPSEGIAPQLLKVQFSYFMGPIAWRPVLVTIGLLLAGNVTGVLLFSRDVGRMLRKRRARRRRPPPWPSDVELATLEPGRTTHDDVIARLGRPDEEHERVAPPGQRSLVYRRTRRSDHGNETMEIQITLDGDKLHEVHQRVRRSRARV